MPKPKTGRMKPCEECGNPFWVIPARDSTALFCSRPCKEIRHRFELRSCEGCGTEFRAYTSELKKWCSRSCYDRGRTFRVGAPCDVCGTLLDPKRNQHRFCSWDCFRASPKKGQTLPCGVCGVDVYRTPSQMSTRTKAFCSIDCKNESLKLDGPGAVFKRDDGYLEVYFPRHPDAGANRRVLQHRLVMEAVLGKRVPKSVHVHHINGIRDDNRPENLEIQTAGDHARITAKEAKAKRRADAVELAEYRKKYGPLT